MINQEDKIHYNTIKLSESIYIHQLQNNNLEELIINYKNQNYKFHKVKFINEFKFYRNKLNIHQYIALRWYNPWEYTAMVEFHDFDIKRILKGDIENDRKEICNFQSDVIFSNNWIEIEFEKCFPNYKQNPILEKMKLELYP